MMDRVIIICEMLVMAILICFSGWVVVSYIDVFMHNLTPNYEYPIWNFFTLFFG